MQARGQHYCLLVAGRVRQPLYFETLFCAHARCIGVVALRPTLEGYLVPCNPQREAPQSENGHDRQVNIGSRLDHRIQRGPLRRAGRSGAPTCAADVYWTAIPTAVPAIQAAVT